MKEALIRMPRATCKRAQLPLLIFGARVSCVKPGFAQTMDDTVGALVQSCEIAVKYPSLEAIQKESAPEKLGATIRATFCYGYFAGILDSNSLYAGMSQGLFFASRRPDFLHTRR